MSERVIPLVDQRIAAHAATVPRLAVPATGLLADGLGRPLRDLRISVTDRCNFRCSYCMPKEVFDKDYPYLPHASLLTFEEITRVARQFVAHGVQKIVLMTAMGANADENAPMRKAEVHLETSGLVYNIIRPNWFMQNFNSFWIQGILEHGKIFLPVGAAKGSFIDARDISAVAARLLSTDDFNQRDFDLTGGVAVDHDAVAAILSKVTGQTITYQDIPESDQPVPPIPIVPCGSTRVPFPAALAAVARSALAS